MQIKGKDKVERLVQVDASALFTSRRSPTLSILPRVLIIPFKAARLKC